MVWKEVDHNNNNNNNTTMPNRDRVEIITQILDVANGGITTRTKITHKTFLSYAQLKEYLTFLTERDLLNYDTVAQTYKITEKGIRLLQFCDELEDMMRKGLQPSSQQSRKRQSSA